MATMRFRGDSPLMDRPSKAWALMRAQDGLISRAQALDAGLSYDQIRYRCTVGEWDIVRPGVFRGAGIRLTPRAVIPGGRTLGRTPGLGERAGRCLLVGDDRPSASGHRIDNPPTPFPAADARNHDPPVRSGSG